MKKKRKKLGRKLLGFLLMLAMMVGLMPGMGMTVRAANGYSPYSINRTHGSGNRPSVLNPGDSIDGSGWDYITIYVNNTKIVDDQAISYVVPVQCTIVNDDYDEHIFGHHNYIFYLEGTPISIEGGEVTFSEYTGEVQSVVVESKTLTAGRDYTVTYSNGETTVDTFPLKKGNYKVVISGIGFYKDELTKNVAFTKDTLTAADTIVTMKENSADVESVVYNSITLTEGADYTVSYKQGNNVISEKPTEVGTYTVVITGNGNYMGTITKDFKIHGHNFAYTASGSTITASCTEDCMITTGLTMSISASDATYDGIAHGAALSTGYNTTAFPDTYVVEYYKGENKLDNAPVDVGDYTAKVTVGTATASVDYKINKAVPAITAPIAKKLTYTGSPQELVNAGSTKDGKLYYAVTTENTAPTDESLYTTSIPTKTEAGTYYVWYKVKGDANHTDSKATSFKVTISKKKITKTVTFKVVNGSWDNGDTKAITVTKSGYEGDTFKLDEKDIPKVGTKPNSGFKAGKWDVTPSTSTVLKEGEVYTYTYAKKDAISVTVTFKVVNGKWNDKTTKTKSVTLKGVEGQVLKLTKDQIPAVGSIPNSGYKKGSWNKTPSTATEIKKNTTYIYTYAKATAAATVTKAPTAMKLTYNGKSQALVKAGTAKNGTMYYAVTTSNTAPKAKAYKTSIPTGKAAGTYYVWYKAKGKTGYKDSGVKKVTVTIAKKTAAIYGFNTSFKCTQTKGKAVISWTKQSNVAKVDAYVTYCGTKFPTTPITTNKNAVTITKINGKKLDQTKEFKIYLVGYDSSGKKVGKTITAHIVGKDSKNYTNVKSFTLNKSEVTIKKGKSTTLKKATIKLDDSKKKQTSDSHAAELRFKTTNPKIAKVDKNGKITGVAAGSCTVYAYARNGLSRKVKVTVTK